MTVLFFIYLCRHNKTNMCTHFKTSVGRVQTQFKGKLGLNPTYRIFFRNLGKCLFTEKVKIYQKEKCPPSSFKVNNIHTKEGLLYCGGLSHF